MKPVTAFELYKEIENIKDMLLMFEDSGEIENLEVYNIEGIKINFNIIKLNKLEILDKIITRLKRRFKYIYILNNVIHLDLTHKGRNYINESLFYKVDNILNRKISNLNEYKENDCIYYKDNENQLFLEYHLEDKVIYIDYETGWRIFSNKYMLLNEDIERLWKYKIEKLLNIEVSEIWSDSISTFDV